MKLNTLKFYKIVLRSCKAGAGNYFSARATLGNYLWPSGKIQFFQS